MSEVLPKRQKGDSYLTPAYVAEVMVDRLPQKLGKGLVVEPSAGTGSWVSALQKKYPKKARAKKIVGVELDEFFRRDLKATGAKVKMRDFLTWRPSKSPVLIAGNPPYSLARQFILHSLELTKESRGTVAFLLRSSILETQIRYREIHSWAPLQCLHVCVNRPSFIRYNEERTATVSQGTEQTVYALYQWSWGHEGPAAVHWITDSWRKMKKEHGD